MVFSETQSDSVSKKTTSPDGIEENTKKLLSQCIDCLTFLFKTDNTLGDTTRKTLNNVRTDLFSIYNHFPLVEKMKKSMREETHLLNIRISNALWTCIEDSFIDKPYEKRLIYSSLLKPLNFPPMKEFSYYLQEQFIPPMTWENRRKEWFLVRTCSPSGIYYTSVHDPECRRVWEWKTLEPMLTAKAHQQAALAKKEFHQIKTSPTTSIPIAETLGITVQPSEVSY